MGVEATACSRAFGKRNHASTHKKKTKKVGGSRGGAIICESACSTLLDPPSYFLPKEILVPCLLHS